MMIMGVLPIVGTRRRNIMIIILSFYMEKKKFGYKAAPAPTHEQIADKAYQIWIEQGCPAGRDLENWLDAERRLMSASIAAEVQRPPRVNTAATTAQPPRLPPTPA